MTFSPIKLYNQITTVILDLLEIDNEHSQGLALRPGVKVKYGEVGAEEMITETLKRDPTASRRLCEIFQVSIWARRLDAFVSTLLCVPAYTSVRASVSLRVSLLSVCLAA